MTMRPCIFGEVLFDHFPDGRRVLGGAPFNVAWHLQAFGAAPFLVTKVGADEDGAAVRARMLEWGMDIKGLGVDPSLPTGQVRVQFQHEEPAYDIVHPAAWDSIEVPAGLPKSPLLYHGSLALRSTASRKACRALREKANLGRVSVFVDVNLRSPWWKKAEVLHSIEGTHWVKLNEDELDLLAPGPSEPEQRACSLLESFGLKGILLTRGSRGAVLLTADGLRREARPRQGIDFKDAVGAGDAMASVMILGLLHDWNLQLSMDRAQELASAIVGRRGATVPDPAFYRQFIRSWSLKRAQTESNQTT